MCNLKPFIIDCMAILGKLGVTKKSSNEKQVKDVVNEVYDKLGITLDFEESMVKESAAPASCTNASLASSVEAKIVRMVLHFATYDDIIGIESGCLSIVLLEHLLYHSNCPHDATSISAATTHSEKDAPGSSNVVAHSKNASDSKNIGRDTNIPKLSLQHANVVEQCCRLALYTSVFGCLDTSARSFYKLAIVKDRAVIAGKISDLQQAHAHDLLATCMKALVTVMKDREFGTSLRTHLLGEMINPILQLCFAPYHKERAECAWFRDEFSVLLEQYDIIPILEHLLLLRSIEAAMKGGRWMSAVCTLLVTRVMLNRTNGVWLVVRAGLNIGDCDDWRHCEAVASLVADAKVKDPTEFYRLISPQVVSILQSKECTKTRGGILPVMSILLGMLMKRSQHLTFTYVGALLLYPLLSLTTAPRMLLDGVIGSLTTNDQGLQNSKEQTRLQHCEPKTILVPSKVNLTGAGLDTVAGATAGLLASRKSGVNASTAATDCTTSAHDTSAAAHEGTNTAAAESIIPTHTGDDTNAVSVAAEKSDYSSSIFTALELSSLNSMWGDGCQVERCLTVLYRTVVLGKGGENCAAIIVPVLCPLLAIASLPSPCKSKLPALNCIVEYLNRCSNEATVDVLKQLLGLEKSLVTPQVCPSVKLYIGSNAEVTTIPVELSYEGVGPETLSASDMDDAQREKLFTDKELIVQSIIKILGKLKNNKAVREFYCTVPRYMNFSLEIPATLLLTKQEELHYELQSYAAVTMICMLLSGVTDDGKLMERLFSEVSEAVPLLHSLLSATAVECSTDSLIETQAMMLFSVVMFLFRFLTGLDTCKKLTSKDWKALKGLLEPINVLQGRCSTQTGEMLKELEICIKTHGTYVTKDGRCARESNDSDAASASKKKIGILNVTLTDDNIKRSVSRIDKEGCKYNSSQPNNNIEKDNTSISQKLLPKQIEKNADNTRQIKEKEQMEKSKHNEIETNDNRKKVSRENEYQSSKKCKREIVISAQQPTSDEDDDDDPIENGDEPNCKNNNNVKNNSKDNNNSDDDDDDDGLLDPRITAATASVYNPMMVDDATASCSKLAISELEHPSSRATCNTLPATQVSDYKTAVDESCSPLIPIRSHGLLSLAKLLDRGDELTLQNNGKLLSLFEDALKEEDSYVYLAAVRGMAALCDASPDQSIKLVCSQLCSKRSVEERSKIAEVMTLTARRLGRMLPHYKMPFINALLNGVRDKEPLIRTASLSCLGEVCKELRFSVVAIMPEIMNMLKDVMLGEQECGPRRAAVLLVTLLLRGLGPDALQVLKLELRDLYRALNFLGRCDGDEVTLTHVSLAIEEINSIMRAFVIPKNTLVKEIHVMHAPQ